MNSTIEQTNRERMPTASRLIRRTYEHLTQLSLEMPLILRNRPLNTAAMLEKDLRGMLLDNEQLAIQKQDAILNYLDKNMGILTEEARTLLFRMILSKDYDLRMYATKIAIPETGDLTDHKTIISIVSFEDYGKTLENFNSLRNYSDISQLEHPIQKENQMGKYWAAVSQTDLEIRDKRETTRIKIRGRKN